MFSTKEADFQQVNSFHNRTRMKKAWTDRAWQTTQLHKTKKRQWWLMKTIPDLSDVISSSDVDAWSFSLLINLQQGDC